MDYMTIWAVECTFEAKCFLSMCVHASDALEVHPKVSCLVILLLQILLQIKLLAGYFTEAAALGKRSLETLKLDKKSGPE